ncbi:exo-alpha-sialidase [Tichowtungia aerotolerans]|uniref:Sialidase domain-containing protein n=1 Tax=Tichowtungia aerotolerans TaxID=2697043 RepID=A0A6P1MA37_9BACT|nr:exo-alpha-sialidase [Tichowtungia aerotolerans]QHI69414.1 hypothetical protein GT409_08090 [Tichowtungia aerotolerans]
MADVFKKTVLIWGMIVLSCLAGERRRVQLPDPNAPIRVSSELLKKADDATWGLPEIPGVELKTVYRANPETGTFVNHPQLAFFKGRMYVGFQLCPSNEDSNDSVAVYSSSVDLKTWTAPEVIGPPAEGNYFRASVGWMQDEKNLYALVLRRDEIGTVNETEYRVTSDGKTWSDLEVLVPDMMGSAGARPITPGGRFLLSGHGDRERNGAVQYETVFYYHDGDDLSKGWVRSDSSHEILKYGSSDRVMSRGIEADWFRRPDGVLVQVQRDVVRSGYVMACVSDDQGATWGHPFLTDIPDSSNMQCAGNLPDGTCYMITTPGPVHVPNDNLQPRMPLVLWLSRDGTVFDRAFLIRSTPPVRRYEGKSKTAGYSYVGALAHEEFLYITYATNKEDVEISCVPLVGLYD